MLCDQFCTHLSGLRGDLANAPDEHSLHPSQDSSLHFLRCASDRHASDVAAQHTHVAKLRSCIASTSAIASENAHQSPISQPFDRERILTIGLVITQKSRCTLDAMMKSSWQIVLCILQHWKSGLTSRGPNIHANKCVVQVLQLHNQSDCIQQMHFIMFHPPGSIAMIMTMNEIGRTLKTRITFFMISGIGPKSF